MGEGLTTALTQVTGIMTTNILPLVTTAPFSYYFALSIIGVGCGVFAVLRNAVH